MKKIAFLFFIIAFAQQASAKIVINEIAWMGTTVSSSNEWIELSNDGGVATDLSGWILSIEGKKNITLSGTLSAGGYYLIERTDDTTVPNIPADLIASFGTGIPNTGAILSLKNVQGTIVDRVDGSNAWTIGGTIAGDNTTKETAQRGASGWFTEVPTPRANNGVGQQSQTQTSSPGTSSSTGSSATSIADSFPVEPQIFTHIKSSVQTVTAGATVSFTANVWGLKKEPIENARLIWAFGDGGRAEGTAVEHIFYYPGDYVIVLDAGSGHYSASDRIAVRVTTPLLSLHTGGDETHSFVALENKSNDEVDLSLWQIESAGVVFVLPQHTLLGARKTLTFPSEITGLKTEIGRVASLRFPNGTMVVMQKVNEEVPSFAPVTPTVDRNKSDVAQSVTAVRSVSTLAPTSASQEASVFGAFEEATTSNGVEESGSIFWWYVGIFVFGLIAFLGIHFVRSKNRNDRNEPNADDFEIIEDKNPF